MNQKVKELEIQGCRTFVCPNLSIINEKGKELNLKEEIIERAKGLAIEYFKMTYHRPHYSSAKYLLPAFIYVASVLEGEKICQADVAKVFEMSHSTIRKWYYDITDTLSIDVKRDRKVSILGPETYTFYLDDINTIGKTLNLKDTTIEKAKSLAIRYFRMVPHYHYYPYVKQLLSAFVYTTSIIENDKRSQLEVYKASGVSEGLISKWHNNILRTFGMKIIGHDGRVTAVLEGQYDS